MESYAFKVLLFGLALLGLGASYHHPGIQADWIEFVPEGASAWIPEFKLLSLLYRVEFRANWISRNWRAKQIYRHPISGTCLN
jgi:hypothetical protein